MNEYNREICQVQNPALGATILWRFVCGYYEKHNAAIPFPLLFIVLPIIFNETILNKISSTQKDKGIAKMNQKLFKAKSNDELFAINNLAITMRALTLSSFNIGMETHLFALDFDSAMVVPLLYKPSAVINSFAVKDLLRSAEKLGMWCADMSLSEISNWLKVRF